MATAGIKAAAYCLNFAPELALHYGGTPAQERKSKPDSEFLRALPEHAQTYEEAQAYAPNKTYIGAMSIDELEKAPAPWIDNLGTPERFGSFGEIMPEDEFLGLMDICDVFDLIWLEEGFAASVAEKLAQNPVIGEKQLARLEKGRTESDILDVVEKQHALPLYSEGRLAGCCRRAHDTDENLEAGIMLENLSCKASGVLALLHLIKNAGLSPSDIDFVVECSEEAVGDAMQRGGGNMAKALAEIAECGNASGFDVRGFCAGPVASVITAASMAACGARANVAVVSGGSVPKLYMNARDHVKKDVKALENCIGSFALLITPDDGQTPVIRLDSLGKHTVGAGAAPQAITSALTFEPLQKAGLKMTDVDKYAPELHNAEITLPAGAGNVPEANYKMIAALSVMKGQIERADIPKFVAERGMPGFVPTQGHIPSGVPYIGHALEAHDIGAGHQPRGIGYRHGVHGVQGDSRLFQCLGGDAGYCLRMTAAGDFRNYAAVQPVLLHLGSHHAGQRPTPVLHYRGCGFVTGGFQGQNVHVVFLPSLGNGIQNSPAADPHRQPDVKEALLRGTQHCIPSTGP